MTTAMLRTTVEIEDKSFDIIIHAWIRWADGSPHVDGDIDFQFTDPEDDTAENYELICQHLDDNSLDYNQLLEEKAEGDGEPIGWNA